MKKAIIVIGLIAVLCFSVSAGGQGEPKEGEPSYMLRFGHVQTEKEEYHKAYIRWARGCEGTDQRRFRHRGVSQCSAGRGRRYP